MNKTQALDSLKDIVFSYNDEILDKLTKFTEALYQLSLQKIPNLNSKHEVARYHVCAFLAAEKYSRILGLKETNMSNIPVVPNVLKKLIINFRERLINNVDICFFNTKKKQERENKNILETEKIQTPFFTPLNTTEGLNKDTDNYVFETPIKQNNNNNENDSIKKGNDLRSSDCSTMKNPKGFYTPTLKSKNKKKNISVIEFIAFAYEFKIPCDKISVMTKFFLANKHRTHKNSDWSLACGIIYSFYKKLNIKEMHKKMDAESSLINRLFQYQKGGLMKSDIKLWCSIVDEWVNQSLGFFNFEHDLCDSEDYLKIKENEKRIGSHWELFKKSGAMLSGDTIYDSYSQKKYYKFWSKKILKYLNY